MSGHNGRPKRLSAFDLAERDAQEDGVLFNSETDIGVAGVWASQPGVDAETSHVLLDGVYGKSERSAKELEAENAQLVSTAIIPQVDGSISFQGRAFSGRGIDFSGSEMEFDEWERMGNTLFALDNALQWFIGDWAAYGIHQYKVTIEQIATQYNRDPHTVETYAWVCRNIPFSLRRESLDFGHHVLLAPDHFDEADKVNWLSRAERGDLMGNGKYKRWSIRRLREELDKTKRREHKPTRKEVVDRGRMFRSLAKLGIDEAAALSDDKRRAALDDIKAVRRHLEALERVIQNRR